jgi:hypothetical protein
VFPGGVSREKPVSLSVLTIATEATLDFSFGGGENPLVVDFLMRFR